MNRYELTVMPPQAAMTFQRIYAEAVSIVESDEQTKLTFHSATSTQPVCTIRVPTSYAFSLVGPLKSGEY
jgi:hypothetical protein